MSRLYPAEYRRLDMINGRKQDLVSLPIAGVAGLWASSGGWAYAVFIALAAGFVALCVIELIIAFADWVRK